MGIWNVIWLALAFTIGATSVAVGILGALTLLRAPRPSAAELGAEHAPAAPQELTPELERQAA